MQPLKAVQYQHRRQHRGTLNTLYGVSEARNKRPHMLGFHYKKCLEQGNPRRWKAAWWLPVAMHGGGEWLPDWPRFFSSKYTGT